MQKPHDVFLFLCCVFVYQISAQLHLSRSLDVQTTVPGTSTCTQRAVCTGRYVGKTDDVYEFDNVRLFACALNSELRYSSCFTPTFI